MLDEGPGDRCGAFGAQGQVPFALVEEVVHLLAHHVGALTHAGEHPDLLEHRALDQPVPGPAHVLGEQGDQGLPSRRFGRQDVTGADGRLERLGSGRRGGVGHDRGDYRGPLPAANQLRRTLGAHPGTGSHYAS